MKKALIILLSILIIGIAGCSNTNTQSDDTITLGIIQIVEHPALDSAREGFLETLKANGYEEGKNLIVDYQNAQGDQSVLQSIAQKFASEKPDLILAIATPSAQAMAAADSEIPILITAVTDPVVAKLVNSLEEPGTNVTGTTDMNPIQEQFELLKKLVPNVKKVGIVFNAGEVNSQVQVDIAKEVALKMDLEILEATAYTSADVLQAAQSFIGKVDAIYVPTDNTVVSAKESVIQVANANNIPLISGESSVVDAGGLATIGINYENLGKQTGEMAIRILNGETPQNMPIESQKDFDTVINKETASLLGIEIPKDL
ncbi:MAG: ABC transporter substrate-binding protein [Eubacteriales bacterium]